MTTTIAIQPLSRPIELTSELLQLLMLFNSSDFEGVYDRLEVWRSRVLEAGPYEELTGPRVRGARIPKDAPDEPASPVTGTSVTLDGLELELLVDERIQLTVSFAGPDPISYAAAAAQVNAQGQGRVRAYVDAGGGFVLETSSLASSTSLRVVGGDAAPQLGLPVGEPEGLAFGIEAWMNLLTDLQAYIFTDYFGSPNFYYKVRFRNGSNGAVGEFSAAFTGTSRIGVAPSSMAKGHVTLVQANGKPLANQEVRIHAAFNGTLVGGKVMVGGDMIKRTDDNGYVEFMLVRGQSLGVSLSKTNLFRSITVPTDPSVSTFNLMDPAIAEEDIFRVAVPDLIFAERTTI